jgi:hypothetical protein
VCELAAFDFAFTFSWQNKEKVKGRQLAAFGGL